MATGRNAARWIIITCGAIQLVTTFDFMGLTIALSDMAADLGVTETDVHWALSANLLAYASTLIIGGRLADLLGHKRVALWGLFLFGGASVLAGFAPTMAPLIAARVLQGIGAAMLTPASLAIVRSSVPTQRIGPAIGAVTAIATIGVAAGPLVGGGVTDLLGWRWIFFMNVPTVALAVTLTLLFAKNASAMTGSRRRIDWAGLTTIVISTAALAVAVDFGAEWGWLSARSIGALALSASALITFVVIELRVRDPLIDLSVFASRAFRSIMTIGSAANLSLAMPVPIFAIYTRTILDMDPFLAGIMLLPFSIAGVAAGPVAGWLFRRSGARTPIVVSVMVAGIGLVLFNPSIGLVSWLPLLVLLAMMGFGSNGSYSSTNMGTQAALDPGVAGQASGTVLTGLVFAAAIGVNLSSELMEVGGEGIAAVSVTTTVGGVLAIFVALIALVIIPKRSATGATPRPR